MILQLVVRWVENWIASGRVEADAVEGVLMGGKQAHGGISREWLHTHA